MGQILDYNRIKNKLLLEFIRNGGGDTKAFLQGMTYLQDYIESNQEEVPLNEYVPEEAVIAVLERQLEEKEKTIKELEAKIKVKNQALKNIRSMSKNERKELRKEEAYRNIQKKYSEMRNEFVMKKTLSYTENP